MKIDRLRDNYPTIASNSKVKVKIYLDDNGEQHVHFLKRNGDDLKLSLESLLPLRKTNFSRDEVDDCQKWLDENFSYVKRKWRKMRKRHYE